MSLTKPAFLHFFGYNGSASTCRVKDCFWVSAPTVRSERWSKRAALTGIASGLMRVASSIVTRNPFE